MLYCISRPPFSKIANHGPEMPRSQAAPPLQSSQKAYIKTMRTSGPFHHEIPHLRANNLSQCYWIWFLPTIWSIYQPCSPSMGCNGQKLLYRPQNMDIIHTGIDMLRSCKQDLFSLGLRDCRDVTRLEGHRALHRYPSLYYTFLNPYKFLCSNWNWQ